MATVSPFKAIRPPKDKVHLVVSRTYSAYSKKYVYNLLEANPYSFVHVLNPEYKQKKISGPNTPARFRKIRKKFEEFVEKKYFISDKTPCFYIYRQTKEDGTSFTGIIGNASIDDYFNGVIKTHEQTLTPREEIFKEYLRICDFEAEPVLISFPRNKSLENIMKKYVLLLPEYNFMMTDRLLHQLWVVSKPEDVKKISKAFAGVPAIYIADGHHRSASSALLGKEMRKKNPGYTGSEGFNYFMCLFVPENQPKISDFNRVIRDLDGLTRNEFLEKLREKFILIKKGRKGFKPDQPHHFSMYLGDHWYLLKAKKGTYNEDHPVKSLDTYILTENILSPILGITDIKNDKRIDFIHGQKGVKSLQEAVDSGRMQVAFGLFPLTMEQIKKVADAGLTMPPKSTWTEPKLRSALTIFSISKGV